MPEYNIYHRPLSEDQIRLGHHRKAVGGLWEDLGHLQFEFMRGPGGLTPGMRLLDLGCGCLRGGVHFVRYLESGHYYGLDINSSLLFNAGYDLELERAGLQAKLPRANLRATEDFDASPFGVRFDRVLAVSLWTHLPLNHIQRSIERVEAVLAPSGRFYTTIFEPTPDRPLLAPSPHPDGIQSYRDRDPYHYRVDDILHLLQQLESKLTLTRIGNWQHPRGQIMLLLERPGS